MTSVHRFKLLCLQWKRSNNRDNNDVRMCRLRMLQMCSQISHCGGDVDHTSLTFKGYPSSAGSDRTNLDSWNWWPDSGNKDGENVPLCCMNSIMYMYRFRKKYYQFHGSTAEYPAEFSTLTLLDFNYGSFSCHKIFDVCIMWLKMYHEGLQFRKRHINVPSPIWSLGVSKLPRSDPPWCLPSFRVMLS